MTGEIIIRQASPEDYPGFRQMEEEAWAGSEIPVISREMFLTWLDVYPQGLRLAEIEGKIFGHIYAQLCDFDPYNTADNRNWVELTDRGYTAKTHNPKGNCLFAVSVSAVKARAGKKLAREFIQYAVLISKQYYCGICRMPGLSSYARKNNIINLTTKEVMKYALKIQDTINKKTNNQKKLFDPTLSVFLSINGSEVCRVVKNFLHDPQSMNWACVVAYRNKNFNN